MEKNDLYTEIICLSNISNAYNNVMKKFYEESKVIRYYGFDGKNIKSYIENSFDFIKEIQQELLDLKPIPPALIIKIPKKKKTGFREVAIHNVKERVKNQAIYQVIEPIVDKVLSKYLFSYRYSHPHYKAIKSVAKRYRKNFKEDYVLVGDITNYTDNMDRDFLKTQIENLGFDKKVNELLFLFVEKTIIRKGEIFDYDLGVVTALPTTVLFYNLYLNNMDNIMGSSSKLYRRVGDDFIIFDSLEKIEKHKQNIEQELINSKLEKQEHKIKIQKASEAFGFLGYKFENGVISILEPTIQSIKKRFRYRLRFYPVSMGLKKKRLLKKIYTEEPLFHDFLNTINAYNQMNNVAQIKKLSDYFFTRLVIYFFGKYTEKNKRLTKQITKNIKIPSLYKQYLDFHTGKYTLEQMRNNIK
jgi:retron-type reverse transcriptase